MKNSVIILLPILFASASYYAYSNSCQTSFLRNPVLFTAEKRARVKVHKLKKMLERDNWLFESKAHATAQYFRDKMTGLTGYYAVRYILLEEKAIDPLPEPLQVEIFDFAKRTTVANNDIAEALLEQEHSPKAAVTAVDIFGQTGRSVEDILYLEKFLAKHPSPEMEEAVVFAIISIAEVMLSVGLPVSWSYRKSIRVFELLSAFENILERNPSHEMKKAIAQAVGKIAGRVRGIGDLNDLVKFLAKNPLPEMKEAIAPSAKKIANRIARKKVKRAINIKKADGLNILEDFLEIAPLPEMEQALARAAGKVGGVEGLRVLENLLTRDLEPKVKEALAKAAGKIDEPEASNLLQHLQNNQ